MTPTKYRVSQKGYRVKFLFDQIKNDWIEFRNTEQFSIVKYYAEESRIYTLLFIVSFSVCIITILSASMIPVIMDVIVPLNETRPHKLPIQIELFIDENEYYYTSYIIISVLNTGIIITMIGSYSMFTTYVQHACGMFSLAGNALEQILNELELTEDKCKSVTNIYDNIVRGIKYHNRAMQFTETINNIYNYCYIIQIIAVMCLMAAEFTRILMVDNFKDNISVIVITTFNIIATLYITFISCYVGQKVLDHSLIIFEKAYIHDTMVLATAKMTTNVDGDDDEEFKTIVLDNRQDVRLLVRIISFDVANGYVLRYDNKLYTIKRKKK
ncbi:odorant receptor 22c-like [Vespula squamosa]|uniref:Odorant receptor 22c-like n=1 Tax=Vespula squamosa TaxID=30214 RepID=A0ABD2C7B9_VESSQ